MITKILLTLVFIFSCSMVIRPLPFAQNKRIFNLVCAILILIVTFRSPEMSDYAEYEYSFSNDAEDLRFEPFFYVIKFICSISFAPAITGFFLFALLSILIKAKLMWKESWLGWASLSVYVSHVLITQEMVAIRAAAASAFLLVAIDKKSKGEIKKTILAIVAAILFHYSAVFFLILLLMDNFRAKRKLYICFIAVSYVLYYLGLFVTVIFFSEIENIIGNNILFAMYGNQLEDSDASMNVFNILQLIRLLICAILWLNYKKIIKMHRTAILNLKLYTIGLCVLPLFANSIGIASRLQDLFQVIEITLFPIGFAVSFKPQFASKCLLLLYSSLIFCIFITAKDYWGF